MNWCNSIFVLILVVIESELTTDVNHRTERESDSNMSPTSDGGLPPSLNKAIDDVLQHMHFTFTKKDGEALEFRCANKHIDQIMQIFPKATYRWLFNNEEFGLDPSRMLFMNGALIFQAVLVEDSGLYICEIEYGAKKVKRVSFYTVIVTVDQPTVRLQASKSFHLQCPSQFIGKLHKHAIRSWSLNGTIYKKMKGIPAIKKEADVIVDLKPEMNGIWTCEARDPVIGKGWKMAFYFLQVDEEPPIWQKKVDLVKKNIVMISVTSGLVFGACLLFLVFVLYRNVTEENKQKAAIESMKEQMVEVTVEGIELEGQSLLGESSLSGDSDVSDGGGDSGVIDPE